MVQLVCALLMLALAASASAAEVSIINSWAQCGGTSCQDNACADAPWMGTQCTEGFDCVRMTSFFWQCKPVATMFGQCGGNGGQCKGLCGDKAWAACPKGSACLRQTAFYWQCVKQEDFDELSKQYSVQSVSIAAVNSANTKASSPQKPGPVAAAPAAPIKPANKLADGAAKRTPAAKPAPGQQQKPVPAEPKPSVKTPEATTHVAADNQHAKTAPRFSWPWNRNTK